MKLVINT